MLCKAFTSSIRPASPSPYVILCQFNCSEPARFVSLSTLVLAYKYLNNNSTLHFYGWSYAFYTWVQLNSITAGLLEYCHQTEKKMFLLYSLCPYIKRPVNHFESDNRCQSNYVVGLRDPFSLRFDQRLCLGHSLGTRQVHVLTDTSGPPPIQTDFHQNWNVANHNRLSK